jgi:hypothetical protein
MRLRPFISYAREDTVLATRIFRDLQAAGIDAWFDRFELRGGQEWEQTITSAIQDCSHFIALLSTHSVNKRGFVQKELRSALSVLENCPPGDVFIIPVRLDDSQPRHHALVKLHWIDLFPSYDEGLARVLSSLGIEDTRFAAAIAASTVSTVAPPEYKRAFLSDEAVLQMVIDRSQGMPKPLDRPLLLFANAFQHTWLVFTNRNLTLVLDDLRKPAVYDPIRWQCRRQEALPVHAKQNKLTLGIISFGSRYVNWLYSVKLHPSPDELQRQVELLLVR